ncbi:MAG: hypothetical protein ACOC6S_01300 [Chloroflexota bacterium]
MMNAIKVIYVLILAAFLIMFVAFGISAFYEPPERPDYPTPPEPITRELPPEDSEEYQEWQAEREQWEEEREAMQEVYHEERKDHRRNVFFIAYPYGLLLIVLGLVLRPRLEILRPGLLLGGVGAIIYAIAQSPLSDELRFAGVAVAIGVFIFAGYRLLLERRSVANER